MIEVHEMDAKPIAGPWMLPKEWEWLPLGDVCKVVIGGTPDRRNLDYWGSGNTWVTIADLNTRFITSSKEEITDLGVANSNVKEIDRDTILMSFKLTIGKLAISGKKLYTNEAIAALPIKASWSERLEKDFIFHALHIVPLSNEADLAVKGRTLNKEKLARILIPIPFPGNPIRSLDIQHRIVERIEALLADLRETQDTLESMRRDIDQVMDGALLEIFNESVTRNWPNREPLGNLAAILARQVDPQQPDYKRLPHIGGESIESGTCRLGAYHTAEEDQVTSGKYLFEPGVILYSKIRPYLRKVAIADFRGLCSADIYPLSVVSNELLPSFLMWSMVAALFTNYVNARSGRARMPKINREELFSYELPFPSKIEQQYIVNHLDSTQESIDELQDMLREDEEILQQVEQGILNQAFRGEL